MTELNRNVVVTDIDISFGRLVMLFVKFGLAAIPAAIVVWLILAVILTILTGIFGSFGFMGMMGGRSL